MKKYILTGLVMLLPLAMTWWIVNSLVGWLTEPFVGITEKILATAGMTGTPILFISAENVLLGLSRLLILLFIVTFIAFVGAIGRRVFFRYLLHLSDTVLHKIPVISSVYKTSQELIQTILTTDNKAFKQVVLVPFPNSECLSIGLVTRDISVAPHLVPIFVPTTPNPTSGYLIMFDRSKVIPLDMSVEEAFRCIISCGVLLTNASAAASADKLSPSTIPTLR